MQSGKVNVGGSPPVELYYQIHGTGEIKLLLIMGLNATCDNWDLTTKHFARSGNFQVCVFDNRGIARSSAPLGMYKTSEMARDTLALLKGIGWLKSESPSEEDKVHVVGISMGGMVAQELAFLMAEQLGSLTLVATHAGHFAPQIAQVHFLMEVVNNWFHSRSRAWTLPYEMIAKTYHTQLDMLLYSMFSREFLQSAAPSGTVYQTNYDYIRHVLVEQVSRAPLQPIVGAFGQLMAATTHRVHKRRLEKIGRRISQSTSGVCPRVLVMAGTNDKIISCHHALYLAETLQGQLQMFVGAGHGLNFERPDGFNAVLRFHIESIATEQGILKVKDMSAKQAKLVEDHLARSTAGSSVIMPDVDTLKSAYVPRNLSAVAFTRELIKEPLPFHQNAGKAIKMLQQRWKSATVDASVEENLNLPFEESTYVSRASHVVM